MATRSGIDPRFGVRLPARLWTSCGSSVTPASQSDTGSDPAFAAACGNRAAASRQLAQTALQKRALDGARRELECPPVRGHGLLAAAEPAQQVGAGRVQQMVRVEPAPGG